MQHTEHHGWKGSQQFRSGISNHIPSEILHQVLLFLSSEDLHSAQRVSKQWYACVWIPRTILLDKGELCYIKDNSSLDPILALARINAVRPYLKHLHLSSCWDRTGWNRDAFNGKLHEILENFYNLQHIVIEQGSDDFCDSLFYGLMLTAISSGASHRLRSLEILTPMRADYLPTAVRQPLTPRFENLTSLSLRFTQLAVPQFGPPLRDEAVLPFFNALSALQCLNIAFSIDYIRDDFSDIARSILRVAPMQGFMDRLALAQLPKLEKLRLANCTFDSELALIRLLSKHSTTLKEFHLHASTMFNARWIPFIRFLGEAMILDKMVHTIELQGVQPYTYYGPMMGDQRVYGPNIQVIWKGAATVVELD